VKPETYWPKAERGRQSEMNPVRRSAPFFYQLEKKQQDPSGLFESEKEIGTGLMAIIVPRGGRV
jgi:hypothetical protein